jgi:hypothetical protein
MQNSPSVLVNYSLFSIPITSYFLQLIYIYIYIYISYSILTTKILTILLLMTGYVSKRKNSSIENKREGKENYIYIWLLQLQGRRGKQSIY